MQTPGAHHSYDLAICDELGLMGEKHRGLVNSLRSSVSARGGKFWSLTVHGGGPFVDEILARRGAPGLVIHHYKAEADCKADDVKAWHAANPGLKAKIKSLDYMRAESARALATPSDMASFRTFDLNLPGEPSREMVCAPSDWRNCTVSKAELPERAGPCFVGFDAGGSSSMTAAAAYWPESLSGWNCSRRFPRIRSFARIEGRADGCGSIYQQAWDRSGAVRLFAGRVTNLMGAFLLARSSEIEGRGNCRGCKRPVQARGSGKRARGRNA